MSSASARARPSRSRTPSTTRPCPAFPPRSANGSARCGRARSGRPHASPASRRPPSRSSRSGRASIPTTERREPRAGAIPAPAWAMWAIPAALFLVAFFHRVAPGVIAKELMQTFGATGTLIGLLSSTYFYAYAGFMIPGGVLIDAYGVRRVVSVGGAVMGIGTLAMAVAPTAWLLFAGRFLVGMGATVTFVGVLKVASVWFAPSRFGALSALSATVGILGSLVATAPLAWLAALIGWRGAFGVVGLGTL